MLGKEGRKEMIEWLIHRDILTSVLWKSSPTSGTHQFVTEEEEGSANTNPLHVETFSVFHSFLSGTRLTVEARTGHHTRRGDNLPPVWLSRTDSNNPSLIPAARIPDRPDVIIRNGWFLNYGQFEFADPRPRIVEGEIQENNVYLIITTTWVQ